MQTSDSLGKILNKIQGLRRSTVGVRFPQFWNIVRPILLITATILTRGKGFRHIVNGVDSLRLSLKQSYNVEPIFWESDQYLEMMSFLHPGDHVIDLGAFWGLFSLGSALRVGRTGRVVAVEPSPRAFMLLQSNIRSNRFDSIIISVKEVCTDKPGMSIDFYADPSSSMIDSAAMPTTGSIQVKRLTTTIDEITGRFNISPKIIKIDVEGFEHLVLKGAEGTLERFRPIIFIEFHPEELRLCDTSVNDVLAFLRERGYECSDPVFGCAANVPRGRLFKFFSASAK